MKASNFTQFLGLAVLTGASVLPVQAIVLYDMKTTTLDGTAQPPSGSGNLYLTGFGSATDVLLPKTTNLEIWLVADQAKNGLPFQLDGDRNVLPGQILGADDLLLYQGATPGTGISPNRPGLFFQTGIEAADSARNANLYYLMFDPAGGSQTFGVFSFGDPGEPEFGNALLRINSAVFADQFSVVPEPEEYAAAAGVGLVAFAGCYRRRARKA